MKFVDRAGRKAYSQHRRSSRLPKQHPFGKCHFTPRGQLTLMHRFIWLVLLTLQTGCSGDPPGTVHEKMSRAVPISSVPALLAYNRGVALREKKEKEKAILEFSNAIKLDETLDIAIYNRALTHAELGHDQEALSDLSRLKKLHSAHTETLVNLLGVMPVLYCEQGRKSLAANDFNTAIDKFTRALLYAQDDPMILELRAKAHRQKGDAAKAKTDQDRAAEARKRGVESIMVPAK